MNFILSKKHSEGVTLYGHYLACQLTPGLLEELDTLRSLGFFGEIDFQGGRGYAVNRHIIADVDRKANVVWLNSAFFEFEK